MIIEYRSKVFVGLALKITTMIRAKSFKIIYYYVIWQYLFMPIYLVDNVVAIINSKSVDKNILSGLNYRNIAGLNYM